MVKGLQCVLQVFTIQEIVISLWSGSVSKSPIQDGVFDEIDDFKFSRFYLQSSIKKPHFEKSPRFPFGLLHVDIKSQSYREFMEHFFFVNAFSHVSLKITRTRAKEEKEKRGFPFDPCFLIGWCVLTVDSSKVLLHTRVLHRVILRAVRVWHNRLSRLRQTHNNVQSLFFYRVWHRCAAGKWEFVWKNFVCWVAQTEYFN